MFYIWLELFQHYTKSEGRPFGCGNWKFAPVHCIKLGLLFSLASGVFYSDTYCIYLWLIVALFTKTAVLVCCSFLSLSKRMYFIFNQLILFRVMVTFTFWHNSFVSFFRLQNLSYIKGTTVYGFLRYALCITVSHILGMKTDVLCFARSFATCIKSHSICVWPGSRKFCLNDFNVGCCVHGIQQNRSDEPIPLLAGAGIRE